MNTEVANWLKALRSGEYPQTKGYLHDSNGFCCLGVLCDISGAGHWEDEGHFQKYVHGPGPSDWNKAVLPPFLQARTGLPGRTINDAMEMNDNGKSFAEIADYIEANL